MEPNYFITFNRDADSYYSYYNNSLCLKKPKCIIYSEKGAALNKLKI